MSLTWKGEAVKRNLVRAARIGIDATMAAGVIHARSNHGSGAHGQQRYESQKGDLERGTKIVQPARQELGTIRGRWGVVGVAQARRIERGFQGKDRLGRVFDQPPFPYLRPAADEEYPRLGGRIRRAGRFA